MKLVYKLTNSKTGGVIYYYYGFSSLKLEEVIENLSTRKKTKTPYTWIVDTYSEAPKLSVIRIVILKENNNDYYEGEIPPNITLEFIDVQKTIDIISLINTEKVKINKQYPFPPQNKKHSYKSNYKDIDPDKQTHEKFGARNYKSKLKI